MTVTIAMPNGVADDRGLNNTMSLPVAILQKPALSAYLAGADPVTVCQGARALLRSDFDGDGTVQWYTEAEGGTLLDEGNTYLTDALSNDRIFYADALSREKVGKLSIEVGDSTISTALEGRLIFDCFTPAVIKSFKVYAKTPGIRFITLRNDEGTKLVEKIVNIPSVGEQRVTVNINLPAQNDLRLQIDEGETLYFNTSGADYPYEIEGVVRINGTNLGGSLYFYFYDWEVEHQEACEGGGQARRQGTGPCGVVPHRR